VLDALQWQAHCNADACKHGEHSFSLLFALPAQTGREAMLLLLLLLLLYANRTLQAPPAGGTHLA
jgi:hypothetical protein